MKMNKKGQIGSRVLVVVFGTILIVAVAIPVTMQTLQVQLQL